MSDMFYRITRGSCWYFASQFAPVAMRGNDDPGNSGYILGVRLVEEVEDLEPTPPASESNRVRRGGGWYSDPQDARVARRNYDDPGTRSNRLGVRLVEEVDE